MIGASNVGSSFFFLIIIAFLVIWLLVVRPQKRRQTQQQRMQRDLAVGDEVLTVGGIYGTVTQLGEDEVSIRIAPELEVRLARRAIAGVTHEVEPVEPEPPEEPVAEEPADVAGGGGSTEENGG